MPREYEQKKEKGARCTGFTLHMRYVIGVYLETYQFLLVQLGSLVSLAGFPNHLHGTGHIHVDVT